MSETASIIKTSKLKSVTEQCAIAFDRYGEILACFLAFLLPIRLIFAYWVLAPLVLIWLLKDRRNRPVPSDTQAGLPEAFLLLVLSFMAISSLGRDPLNSLRPSFTLLLFACVLFIFRELSAKGNSSKLLFALVGGQTLAAINSFFGAVLPEYPRLLTGKVSESGQLGITIFVALGLCAAQAHVTPGLRKHLLHLSPIALLLTFLLSVLAFSPGSNISSAVFYICGALSAILIMGAIFTTCRVYGRTWLSSAPAILLLALPFLSAALLSNLKRGPWAGVLVGAFVFALQYARRWAIGILLIAAVILLSFQPIRTRILQSPEHFFISGGRSEIWQIGTELTLKYPLGLGLKNSKYLRDYSPAIPAEMRHFHNNLLNVAAETGWIGLGIFLWWISKVLLHAFRTTDEQALAKSLGCALISWQIAGLVEYNFGDSEVLLVAILVIGVLSSFRRS